jgi:predicted NUDIX family phosphoesterase
MSIDVSTECVMVVPTAVFHELGHFQGFSGDTDRYVRALLDSSHISYRPRSEMETNPDFKQLIPYVICRYRDPAGDKLFQYTRGGGQGEKRLHKKRSVGIGGHISSDDASAVSGQHPYEEGMRRELDEEVSIDCKCTQRCVGLINDDQTEVGRVHLGVVHVFDLERPSVEPRETDLVDCGFRSVSELLVELDGFETWSQICLKALFAG